MSRPAWGNPWRGKVQGGAIALPGGASKITEQPQQLNARHYDELGATYLQRGPLAAVTRSPEELAADAAAGRTWRTDAILSGARMHLYGTRLDGWVYCAADGSRWLVSAAPLTVALQTDQPFTASLTLTRFGDFSGPAAQQSVAVSLAELGQAEPDPTHPAGIEAYCAVCDIRPDGSKALLMIYQPVVPFAQSSGWHPLHKRPLGWLELEFSAGDDGFTSTLTVVRTRSQALGSGVWDNYSATDVAMWLQSDSASSVDKGTYYEYTYTPQPLAASGSSGWGWIESSSAYQFGFSGRILALWYDSEGIPEEVTLDALTYGSVSNPPPIEVVSGTQVQHIPKDGSPGSVISDTRQHSLSRTCTVSETYSVVLKRAGVVIDSSSGTASVSLDVTRRFITLDGQQPYSGSRTESVVIEGVTDEQSSEINNSGPVQAVGQLSPVRFTSLMPGNSAAQSSFRATGLYVSSPGGTLTIDPLRYSNNLIGLRRQKVRYSNGSEAFSHGPAAIPGGSHPGLSEVGALAIFGSYNPATSEVSRDQTTPVCWV